MYFEPKVGCTAEGDSAGIQCVCFELGSMEGARDMMLVLQSCTLTEAVGFMCRVVLQREKLWRLNCRMIT